MVCASHGPHEGVVVRKRSGGTSGVCGERVCFQYTAPRTCHTSKHFFACGSSGAHASQSALFCVISQTSHPHQFMSNAQCTSLGRISLPLQQSTPSLPYPLNGSIPCNSQHGVPFGRLAETILSRLAVRR